MLRVITFSVLVLLISCSDDSGTGPGNGGDVLGTFSVDINGTKWKATQNIVFASYSESESFTVLSVSGGKSISPTEAQAIAFTVSAEESNLAGLVGTYSLGVTGGGALAFTTTISDDIVSYLSLSGEVTVTEITTSSVVGTFNAICVNTVDQEDTLTMTNGIFNAILATP